jgi:hypothetical protein
MAHDQETARALYKRLLDFYPRAFRERLGESMEQTFDDLWRERKGREEGGVFGFALGVFVETAVGIVREHVTVIREKYPMEVIRTNLRWPALVGFLVVLPFMLLELSSVARRPAGFGLRNAVDFAVVFGFLWLGLTAIIFILTPIARSRRSRNGIVEDPARTEASSTKGVLANPTAAAVVGFFLALPFASLLTLFMLGIEPPLGHLLDNPDPDRPDVLGSLVVLGTFLLAVLACVVVRAPIVRAMRAGGSLLAHPVNLVLAVAIVSFIATLVAGVFVDQFPCWIGVPNCD